MVSPNFSLVPECNYGLEGSGNGIPPTCAVKENTERFLDETANAGVDAQLRST